MTTYFFPLTEAEASKDSAVYKGLDYALKNSSRFVTATTTEIVEPMITDFARYIKRVVIDGIVYDPNLQYYDITNNLVIIMCVPRTGVDELSETALENLQSL